MRRRRVILEALVEERPPHRHAELARGVAVEAQRAERAAVVVDAGVPPRPEREEAAIAARVLGLERVIARDRAVHVLLVPQARDDQRRHDQRLGGEKLDDRQALPVRIVRGVFGNIGPERQLVVAVQLGPVAGRAGAAKRVVVVVAGAREVLALAVVGGLAVDVREVGLAERAVVEPVVALPAVDHRAHRHRRAQRRVGMEQRHQHGEALVRAADHADLAVALRDVLDQPVDGVERVGRVIDRAVVERAAQRPRHHVVALAAVLAAHVLEHADVAAVGDRVVADRQHVGEVRARDALGTLARVVRRAREDDRQALGARGDEDDGVQLDAVAHRDHDVALVVVGGRRRRRELRRDVGLQRRRLRRRRRGGAHGHGDEDAGDDELAAHREEG